MRVSPLDRQHRDLGAKMVPFGGWEMPLQYEGTVVEHLACRNDAVVFDVSHLGTVQITAPDGADRIQRTLSNDLTRIGPGRAQYTHLLADDDASVLDDIIVWWHPDGTTFDVMPNASNTEAVLDALGGRDVTSSRAVLAVQGPQALRHVASIVGAGAVPGRFEVVTTRWRDTDLTIAGTGYTGESGVEIAVPADDAPTVWEALIETGVRPAGLGARDTLRLEAGYPLHGHELGPGITPLQANLAWVVAFDKGAFRGRDALLAERERGVERLLRGLVTDTKRPLRSRADVVIGAASVGTVTSGNVSPVLGVGIALAFVPPDVTLGQSVQVNVRGHEIDAEVVAPPFVS